MADNCIDCDKDISQEIEYRDNHIQKDLYIYDDGEYVCGDCFDTSDKNYQKCSECDLIDPEEDMYENDEGEHICVVCS